MIFKAAQHNNLTRSATVSGGGGFLNMFGGVTSKSGVAVTSNSALTLSAFYNGVTILCNDYAKLPKHVIQKTDGDINRLSNHPVDYLINQRPNQYMNSFGFDSVLMKNAILKGNGYAEKVVNSYTGKVESLQYIDQSITPVTVKKFENKLWYHFDGRVVASENMLHYRSLYSDNGITGIGIVAHAAKSLGVALSSQEFAEEYYASKGIGTGIVTTTKDMDPDAKKRYGSALSGVLSSKQPFKVAVVDEAGSFQHIKLTPQESMFLETNKHAIGEVARWLNIPTYKLKDTENQNNSNMENQSISHVSDSVLPWSIINNQEYNAKLFTDAERKNGIKARFNTESLLQSDKKTQLAWYIGHIYAGSMTRNEVRNKMGLNSLAGLDEPLTAVNMQTMKQVMESLKLQENE
ncbi:phage portal protein [Tenacibaculum soleae]|uniref:Phage portal protein n=1 Tax=Tenacibaculum soleae TaxID=447689 RepID=A0A1B9Y3J7_9FLAO|nr:phage portal protein [Tenacibaculum soleae]OCK44373.1 phage portal protein [Tenacibaculum soleae]